MANFDLKGQINVNASSKRTKILGWGVITVAVMLFLTLITGLLPFLNSFFLGALGLFIYPLLVIAFCIGVALLTNKHYVLPIKYLVLLCVAVVCVLAIINAFIISPKGDIGEYLLATYNAKLTAGGLVVSVFVAPLMQTVGLAGTIIVFGIVLIIVSVLIVDCLRSIKKYGFKKVVKHTPVEKKNVTASKPVVKQNNAVKAPQKTVAEKKEVVKASEEFNLFLDKKMQEQENKLALMKLGLIEGNLDSAKKPETEKKMTLREYLLTPPDIEETYFAKSLKQNHKDEFEEEIQKNVDILKAEPSEEDNFEQNDFEDDFDENFYEEDFEECFEENEYETNDFNEIKEEKSDENNGTSQYVFPPITLLNEQETQLNTLNENIVQKRALLEETLQTFGINARVKGVVIGPSVTRYEIEMPHGVSVRRIVALQDDISMALASRAGVRIEAPIPGKSAVGIEVPNEQIATVTLREVLESDVFKKNTSPVTFALGKNISGATELCNLAKMPHILVAGATNSGKSICLNAIILSMIYKASPEDLRLILIDPKRVEFSLYNDLPHLLIPKVITEVDKAVNALLWCVNEMERRFELLSMARCRNSEEYNSSVDVKNGTAPKMPYIVVIVDELADLMTSGKKELEEYLRRLTQKARAAGILLVLATQRPSVDVITGVIKTNCPARISFALTSAIDSRTILDSAGAESLLGRGDMLYKPSDAPSARRVQGCFVSAEEVERVVEFIKANTISSYDENTEKEIDRVQQTYSPNQIEGNIGDPKWDPLLPQALKMFIENGSASTSAIQRRFLAGFPRASRIVDQLCQMGYLSQQDGTKPRAVLITMEEFNEKFGTSVE